MPKKQLGSSRKVVSAVEPQIRYFLTQKKNYRTRPKIIKIRVFGLSPVNSFCKKVPKTPPKQCVLDELFLHGKKHPKKAIVKWP